MKLWGGFGVVLFVVSLYQPIMYWFEYDMNLYKPRMNEYLLNRIK